MSKELVISANRHETRVAMIEDDQVVEIFHQRENEYSLAGSIHKGRVTRVLPGMQSAFVDIGLERDAFLYVSDFFEDNEEYDKIVTGVEEKVLKLDRTGQPIAPAGPIAESAVPVAAGAETVAPPPAAESAPVFVQSAPPPAPSPLPQPGGHPERRDDRDSRGRRSRRRRGGKNAGRPAGFQILFAGAENRARHGPSPGRHSRGCAPARNRRRAGGKRRRGIR